MHNVIIIPNKADTYFSSCLYEILFFDLELAQKFAIIFGIATLTMVVWTQREAIHELAKPEVHAKQSNDLDERVEQLLAQGEALARQH